VLASVNLDDKPRASAFEIDHIRKERGLAPKVEPKCTKLTQAYPEFHFLGRHSLAQLS